MGLKQLARKFVPLRLRQAAQAWRIRRSINTFKHRIVRHRYGEAEFEIELPDPLAEGWYDHDWPQLAEIELLRRSQLRTGATVFDLGAHQGVVALMLAREVGPNGKVIAVEALPHNAAAAIRNRDINRMPWIEVVGAGVAAENGVLSISRSFNAQTSSVSDYGGTVQVPAMTIDTLSVKYGRPDVLFIDVEGMELSALAGARQTLATGPDAFVEVHVGEGLEASGGSVAEVLGYFPETEYELFVHSDSVSKPIPMNSAPAGLFAARFFLTALSRRFKSSNNP